MPRPQKCRKIAFPPEVLCFKPAGIPMSQIESIQLSVDEMEAIRLADMEGLYQADAAQKMGISRQTFGNILVSAHFKIADCIINSKSLVVEGGNVEMVNKRTFTCFECNNVWSLSFGKQRPDKCPECENTNIHRSESDHENNCSHPQEQGRRRRIRQSKKMKSQNSNLQKIEENL